jgi:mannose-6-phosphate isomerase-like protein (cupin superfamily)
MHVKRLRDCPEIAAGDHTRLRELLHPDRDPVAIRYSLAVAWLDSGSRSAPHRLKSSEVYFIIRGSGVMHVDAESAPVEPGDAVYIPAGSVQWLENPGATAIEFACIVDPAWRAEDEQVL